MGLFASLAGALDPRPAVTPAEFSTPATEPVGVASTTTAAPSTYRAAQVARAVALRIPAVRSARASILRIATFRLRAWEAGEQLADNDPRAAWLRQPEANQTAYRTLALTLDDAIWNDIAVWKIERNIAGPVAYVERVHPERYQAIRRPNDPDTIDAWIIDGRRVTDAQLRADHAVFDWAGTGGLRTYGAELLQLYGDLQAAAGRYAVAPHPHAILKNSGADLDDDEIDALLDEWEAARSTRSVGYLNSALDYEAQGWNARELQLTEAREHAAVEVARLFGLPAWAIDANGGDSMTYANVTDRRRDVVEALRPWSEPIVQGVSLDDRRQATRGVLLPRGVTAAFDASSYLQPDAETRMRTWQQALAGETPILTLDEVRSVEPLARKATA
jgi:phage portal protein BeeE